MTSTLSIRRYREHVPRAFGKVALPYSLLRPHSPFRLADTPRQHDAMTRQHCADEPHAGHRLLPALTTQVPTPCPLSSCGAPPCLVDTPKHMDADSMVCSEGRHPIERTYASATVPAAQKTSYPPPPFSLSSRTLFVLSFLCPPTQMCLAVSPPPPSRSPPLVQYIDVIKLSKRSQGSKLGRCDQLVKGVTRQQKSAHVSGSCDHNALASLVRPVATRHGHVMH